MRRRLAAVRQWSADGAPQPLGPHELQSLAVGVQPWLFGDEGVFSGMVIAKSALRS